jgi:iron complex outermembrane receptor protein
MARSNPRPHFISPLSRPSGLALACALALGQQPVFAQSTEPQRTEPVTVVGKAAPVLEQEAAEVGGFAAPLTRTPQSVSVLGADLLTATGARTLSRVAALEAGLADSYNAVGYLENLTVRGFELRGIGNYRRNGLAWNNIAPLASESIERVEVLKGVAGMLAGVASPGGLVNFVSKQPLAAPAMEVTTELTDRGNRRVHLDANARLSAGAGLRVNLAAEALRPPIEAARGERQLAHFAWTQALRGGRFDLDAEWSRQRQPSVPGFGLLDRDGDGVGESLPAISNARRAAAGVLSSRLNLNAQPWSLPVVSESAHLGGEWRAPLGGGWEARLAARHWQNRLDDRIAFPDGCSAAAVYVYPGWCGDGSVDVYDYRSENERRRLTSALAEVSGRLDAPLPTRLTAAVGHYNTRARLEPFQAYNYVGTIDGFQPTPVEPAPEKTDRNTNSNERSTDLVLRGKTLLGAVNTLYWGASIARLERASARSNGSRAVRLAQTLATPWLGLTHDFSNQVPGLTGYLSWGQGVEAEVVPNRPAIYTNAGSVLAAAKSRQWEAGLKWQAAPRLTASLAAFEIRRPSAEDVPTADDRLLRLANARTARHRGLEAMLAGRLAEGTSVHLSAAWLDARVVASTQPERVGERAPNVPRTKLAAFVSQRIDCVPGLSVDALLTHEAGKRVEAPIAVRLPAMTLLDLGLTYDWRHAHGQTRVRLAAQNVTNRAGWREAPTAAWGGVYLFPVQARTVRLSLTHAF